jgi:hypothetical protein
MADQPPIGHEPAEAFTEHLTLPKDMINEIQAAASINTQANIQQNKDNDDNPEMVVTVPPVE